MGNAVFEKFTDRARRVVVRAQEEARALNHDFIGTEHILLGLVGEGQGVAAKALESLGISLETVRQRVEDAVPPGQYSRPGHIPFTPRAKKVLELSLSEAKLLGHPYIGTEHILLGLLREGEGVAVQVLAALGADLDGVPRTGHPAAGRIPGQEGWSSGQRQRRLARPAGTGPGQVPRVRPGAKKRAPPGAPEGRAGGARRRG